MTKIGIYDSGCGGISVVNQLLNTYNNIDIYYYADSLNNPWGNKSKEELSQILQNIAHWFNEMGIDSVICGCN